MNFRVGLGLGITLQTCLKNWFCVPSLPDYSAGFFASIFWHNTLKRVPYHHKRIYNFTTLVRGPNGQGKVARFCLSLMPEFKGELKSSVKTFRHQWQSGVRVNIGSLYMVGNIFLSTFQINQPLSIWSFVERDITFRVWTIQTWRLKQQSGSSTYFLLNSNPRC